MISWTIRWILFSLVLIFLIHYLYIFFKTTLTVPKVKDLVNKPTEKYNEILNTIKSTQSTLVETPNKEDMQSELKSFLNDLKKPQEQEEKPVYYSGDTDNVFSNY
tara:strand:- start:2410 stop:2724 length:315 start_codon:yes stop_codon:yes gene_type:complete